MESSEQSCTLLLAEHGAVHRLRPVDQLEQRQVVEGADLGQRPVVPDSDSRRGSGEVGVAVEGLGGGGHGLLG